MGKHEIKGEHGKKEQVEKALAALEQQRVERERKREREQKKQEEKKPAEKAPAVKRLYGERSERVIKIGSANPGLGVAGKRKPGVLNYHWNTPYSFPVNRDANGDRSRVKDLSRADG